MKKTLFTLIIIGLAGVSAFAQLNGGLKAGLNIANFSGDDADGADPIVGFHIGGYLVFDLTDAITLQPELLYNVAGAKYSESGTDPDLGSYTLDITQKLNYISVPIMFGYKLGDKFSIQVGPQISFLASAKAEFDLKSDLLDFSDSEDNKSEYKGTDFGLNFGLGANFGKFNASARYSLGLSEIPDAEANVKNNVIQFSIGYKLFGE